MLEGALLAQHLLVVGHPVRDRAEAAFAEWQHRCPEVGQRMGAAVDVDLGVGQDPSTGAETPSPAVVRARPSEVLHMLIGPKWRASLESKANVASGARSSAAAFIECQVEAVAAEEEEEPLSNFPPWRGLPAAAGPPPLTAAERMSLGLRAPVDMRHERRCARQRALLASAPSTDSVLGSESSSKWDPLASSSRPNTTWGARSAPPGELYTSSVDWGPDGLPHGRSWRAHGRVPIYFSMRNAGGKAEWALRSGSMAELSRGRGGKKKVNVFQDWLVNVAGDAKPLKKKVLETVTGQEDFFMNMREQSRRFRNFYLKEEVDEEKLGDDRILYTATGVALKEKLKRQAEAKNAAAAEKARRAEEEARWVEEASWAGEAEGSPPEDLAPASRYSGGMGWPRSASPQP